MKRNLVAMFLYNAEGKILMQHRSEDAKFLAGYWGCFGGGIEEGETPEQAVRRELMEELEYTLHNPVYLGREDFTQMDGNELTSHTFVEQYDPTQKLVLHEGQGYGWYTIDEARKLKITDHRREMLGKIEEYLKNNGI